MKLFSSIKRSTKLFVVATAVSATVIGASFVSTAYANISLDTVEDCDDNAVIYCGGTDLDSLQTKYQNGDNHNSTGSIHDIYDYFSVSSSDVSSMDTTAVAGYVTKNGNVYAGGELVATNALTAGRQDISGSTRVSHDGTTFYTRAPSVSFVSERIDAYVVMINGKFSFAVLGSCGNPVKATPKTPDYNVSKEVRVKGQSTWQNNVSVKSGTHVEYRVIVASTGQVSAKNIVVSDKLPANVSYINNTLKRDGTAVSADDAFFGTTGNTIASLAAGKSVIYTFEAVIGSGDNVQSCAPQTLVNSGRISSPGLPNKEDDASVTKTCAPKPAYSCDAFEITKGNNRTITVSKFNYTAKDGAVFNKVVVDWGDNSAKYEGMAPVSQTHTYGADGSYTIKATAHFTVSGVNVTASENCTQTVSFTTAPVTPPTELIKSGPAGTLGIFAVTTIVATVLHRLYMAGRYGRQS